MVYLCVLFKFHSISASNARSTRRLGGVRNNDSVRWCNTSLYKSNAWPHQAFSCNVTRLDGCMPLVQCGMAVGPRWMKFGCVGPHSIQVCHSTVLSGKGALAYSRLSLALQTHLRVSVCLWKGPKSHVWFG